MQHDGDARVERHAWGNSGENYLHSSSPAIDRNDARVPVYRRLNAVAYNHSDSDSGDETDEELVILSTNALSKTLPTSARKSSASMAGTGQPREGSLDGTWHAAEFIGVERQPEPTFADDVKRSRFPFAIVWTPIPCLTWFFPFIGHMGICDSRGVSYDFAGQSQPWCRLPAAAIAIITLRHSPSLLRGCVDWRIKILVASSPPSR